MQFVASTKGVLRSLNMGVQIPQKTFFRQLGIASENP
jgi:hypothetical protein